MISEELRKEWLEKVSVGKREDIPHKDTYSGFVTINTPLRTAPEEVWADREITERALLSGEEYFWNIHKNFKTDKEFILSLMQQDYKREVFTNLDYALRGDADIFRQFVLKTKKIPDFFSLPTSIINNKELVLELLPHLNFYRSLDKVYEQDKDVLAIYMIHHVPHFFNRLGKRMANHFKKDKPFLIEFLKVYPEAYKEINPKLLTDLEIIDSLLSKNPKSIAWLPIELRDDKGFMIYAIQKYGCTLTDAQSCHSNDFELVKLSIEKNGKDLFNSKVWSNSSELLEIAMQTEPHLSKVDSSVWKDINLVIKYLDKEQELKELRQSKQLPSNSSFYYSFPNNLSHLLNTMLPELRADNKQLYKEYITNKKIIKLVIENDIEKLNLFPGWKNNPELCDMAFTISNSISHLHESKLYDREYMLELIKGKSALIKDLSNYTNYYMNDYDFLNEFLYHDPALIKKSPIGRSDKNLVIRILSHTNLSDITFIDSSLLSDKDIVLKFIEKSPSNYSALPLKLKQDDDVINKMLEYKTRGASIVITDSGFGNDFNFLKKMASSNFFFYEAIEPNSPFKSNRELIECYLDALITFESTVDKSRQTNFPVDVLLKYDIENGLATQIRPSFLRFDLEVNLPNKNEVIAPKKFKV